MPTHRPTPVILLAEDSEDDAYFFQRALKKADVNCSLVRAENGKQAVDFLGQNSPESENFPFLVFLDLKMPVMSGFDVLEWLACSKVNPRPRIIVLSGSNDQVDRERALSLGATEYLVKPITPEMLKENVARELDGYRQVLEETEASA
jgi:CheY-like chemotaxis protein